MQPLSGNMTPGVLVTSSLLDKIQVFRAEWVKKTSLIMVHEVFISRRKVHQPLGVNVWLKQRSTMEA